MGLISIAVADQLDDAAVVAGNRGVEHGLPVLFQRGERAFLVGAHQARITDHVGGEDRREFAIDAFFGHLAKPREIGTWLKRRKPF